jgi:ribose 5-phosphate isomerase
MSSSGIAPQATRGAWKFFAAEVAAALVEDGKVVGLGAGSTAAFAVETLARQGLRFVGIPTSERTAEQAKAAGIPLTSFAEHRHIDLTIDGADEVECCTLIEGLGGVLPREKIVAASSRRLAIVVDGAKLVDRLGERTPVPVEVVPFGLEATREAVDVLGATARLRRTPAAIRSSPTAAIAHSRLPLSAPRPSGAPRGPHPPHRGRGRKRAVRPPCPHGLRRRCAGRAPAGQSARPPRQPPGADGRGRVRRMQEDDDRAGIGGAAGLGLQSLQT